MTRTTLAFWVAALRGFAIAVTPGDGRASTACEAETNPTLDGITFLPCELLV